MEKTDVLRRIVSVLLILTLVTSLFVNLPLSLSAEDGGLQGGQSNIINGSFEQPIDGRSEDLAKDTPSCYKYTSQSTVPGWNTTAVDEYIELAWMNNNVAIDKASPHMKPTIQSEITGGNGPSDGWQFAETIANEPSTIFQSLSVNKGEEYNWTVHHRGRDSVETLAVFIVDDAGVNYVKSAKSDTDHFYKILNWMKASPQSVTAPAAGEMKSYTVYTTALLDDGAFESADSGYFSFKSDNEHKVKFQLYLMSTAKADWGEYKGTYTPDSEKILFAITSFVPFGKTSGNLIDNISFTDSGKNNLLKNPGFEDFESTSSNGYQLAGSANHPTNPTKNIGWSTTASDCIVEIGTLRGGTDVYKLGVTIEKVTYNAPSIRDGDQFAELNASEESSLYQIVNTDPGKMYKWSLSHRGRDAIDTMALIIGPAQDYAPKKVNKNSRDQLMQISDWLYSQTDMPLDLPKDGGCSDKIKLYTPKFNSTGGWTTDSNIFSFYKDSIHTEEWSVWVIASKNDKWHDYGELDASATYSYECVIPEGQKNTIFGFVSHSSYKADGTKNSMSYGNLLDNIAFKEYYYAKVEVSMNNKHGSAYITSGEDNSFIEDGSPLNGWALQGSAITVYVKPTDRNFIGAYINGKFYPNTEDDTDVWEYDTKKGEYYYTFTSVQSAIKVNIIFSAKQIYYDSRSKHIYQYDNADGGPEVQMSLENDTYISHAPKADDGWKFIGWKYINPKDSTETVFNAEHTVTLVGKGTPESPQTFEVSDGTKYVDGIPYDEGITFLGEWMYRQRATAQTYNEEQSKYVESTVGGTVNIAVSYGKGETSTEYINENSDPVGRELYAYADDTYVTVTATRKAGYTFNGWYDGGGNLISKNANYVYKVNSGTTKTLYARFDPAGCNLGLKCSNYSTEPGDTDKKFKINCSLSGLRAGKSYTLSYVSGGSVSNKTFTADTNGNATFVLNMKHGDYAEFIYLPVDSKYTIIADETSSAGFGVKGEVKTEKTLTKPEDITVITEHIIFYKASQSVMLEAGKHYKGISADNDPITITKRSSFTFQAETRYNPSIYANVSASLCFYSTDDAAKEFFIGTRILMIDLSNSAIPKYYSYTVNASTSAIALTEFTELGSTGTFTKTGDMLTEKLLFIVDYVGTENAESGKISLVYGDDNNELSGILTPVKKTVNIGVDTTEITADVGDGKASRGGPFAINITVTESNPAINTTYKEDDFTNSKYAIKLSVVDDSLPDGSYAEVGGDKYFLNNGYIKIPSITAGACKVNVYSPVPISSDTVTFNVTLSDAVSASPKIPVEKTVTVQFNCVNVAMDADVVDKVLNPGSVSSVDVKFKHNNLDSVGLTVYEKGSSAPITAAEVKNPTDGTLKFSFGNNLTVESGKTYIFSFVGYVNGVPVLEDKCCVVGGYVSKQNNTIISN